MKKQLITILLSGSLMMPFPSGLMASDNSPRQGTNTNIEKLQQEITYLKDNQEIRNLLNDLNLPVDASDAARYKANYVPGGIFELIQERNGKPSTISKLNTDQMEAFLNSRFEIFKKQGEQRRHLQTSIHIVEQDSDQAKATITGLLLTTVKHREMKLVSPLFYVVDLIKVNGAWKFKHVTGYLDTSLDAVNHK